MRLLPLTALAFSATLAQAKIVTSTIFYGICWTGVDGGTITTSLPGATATYHDPSTRTLTFTAYTYLPTPEKRELTVVEIDQCTLTETATVTSTVRELVPTITATVTEWAATSIVTYTSTCTSEDWDCF